MSDDTTMERRIEFYPAYDKRDPDPTKSYGIGSVMVRFLLIGERGAIQFLFSSGWVLPHVAKEYEAMPGRNVADCLKPMGFDLGYHSHTPMYEGQELQDENCDVLGGPCYYDGSGLAADEVLQILITEGHDAVWERLEQEYTRRFLTERNDDERATAECERCKDYTKLDALCNDMIRARDEKQEKCEELLRQHNALSTRVAEVAVERDTWKARVAELERKLYDRIQRIISRNIRIANLEKERDTWKARVEVLEKERDDLKRDTLLKVSALSLYYLDEYADKSNPPVTDSVRKHILDLRKALRPHRDQLPPMLQDLVDY